MIIGAGLIAGTLVAGEPPASAAGQPGQLQGQDGCVSYNGGDNGVADACRVADTVRAPTAAVVSPDGRFLYVATSFDAVVVFARNAATGALAQLPGTSGCISRFDHGGRCAVGVGLSNPQSLAMSPDGRHLYVVGGLASTNDAIALLRRDEATGVLQQFGCLARQSDYGDELGCSGIPERAPVQSSLSAIAISPDGASVFVGDFYGTLSAFSRAGGSGQLTYESCLVGGPANSTCSAGLALLGMREITVSPDGSRVITAASGYYYSPESAVSSYRRAGTDLTPENCVSETGMFYNTPCADGRAIRWVAAVAVSPDGRHVYAKAANGVATLAISDSGLTQVPGPEGCVTTSGTDDSGAAGCSVGRGFGDSVDGGVVVSPDGSAVYTVDGGVGGVGFFDRDAAGGALTQLPGDAGCVVNNGPAFGCGDSRATSVAAAVTVSPAGENVYVMGRGSSAIAVFGLLAPPACEPSAASVAEGGTVAVNLPCADSNGDRLVRRVTSAPAHGTLTNLDDGAATVAYAPDPGYVGADSFTYVANDGTSDSLPATVTISVLPTLRVTDSTITEGDERYGSVVVSINLSSPAPNTVDIELMTADGTAVSSSDYYGINEQLQIPTGSTTGTIEIVILGDHSDEPTERFSVTVGTVQGAVVADADGVVTIADDDTRLEALCYSLPLPALMCGAIT